jgi:DNA-binding SARP family transcriptional activator/tetratricopeptide (TPR) repeat protein
VAYTGAVMPDRDGLLRFEVLGALRAWRGDKRLAVGWPGQQAVLAALLLRDGYSMARDDLIDAVWGPDPPATAANIVQGHVARLRKVLEPARASHAPGRVLVSAGSGYMLQLSAGQLDLRAAQEHLATARRARGRGDVPASIAALDTALGLWHGTPLSGVPGPLAELERTRLEELRLTALEDRAEAALSLGGAADLAGELPVLVAQFPFREQFRALLMIALYRSGRQADALAVYADTRRVLVRELGVEPCQQLQQLHEAILNNRDAEIGMPSVLRLARPVALQHGLMIPRQLPPPAGCFVGRAAELRSLTALADRSAGEGGTVVITSIDGTPGVGKTALALQWAHQVANRFTDGQLYIDLRGFDPREPPLPPSAALERMLSSLGVDPQHIPSLVDEQAACYRTLLAGRRSLVVLDNAASAEQVRPLLPGGQHCFALVTSRHVLTGLVAANGAHRIALDVLAPAESARLLEDTIGRQRVSAEPDAVARLADLCGHLPLALRIAAARVAARPHNTLGDLVAELAVERLRLDVLAADEATSVRAAFSWSYQTLPAATARAFRLLGLHPGTDISAAAASALTAETHIGPLLETLTDAHLLQQTARARYRMHDLLRLYATERADAEDGPAEREAAISRLLAWYLHAADAADRMLIPHRRRVPLPGPPPVSVPGFACYDDALAWCENERTNLIAVTRLAAALGHHDIAWQLPVALWGFFMVRKPWSQWEITNQIGLAAARHLSDSTGQAHILGSLAFAHLDQRRHTEALECTREALVLCRATDDKWGVAVALLVTGMTHRQLGQHTAAVRACHEALAAWQDIHDTWGVAHTLYNLGDIYQEMGKFDEAVECHRHALRILDRAGDRWGQAHALTFLGVSLGHLNRHQEALDCLTRALQLRKDIGDRRGEAQTLYCLAAVLNQTGAATKAHAARQAALTIFEELGDPQAATVRAQLKAPAT